MREIRRAANPSLIVIGVLAGCVGVGCSGPSPASLTGAKDSGGLAPDAIASDANPPDQVRPDVAADDAGTSPTSADGAGAGRDAGIPPGNSDAAVTPDAVVTPCIPLQGAAAKAPLVSSVFGSHMVLQRGVKAPIWGFSKSCGQVSVTVDSATQTVTADAHGKWIAYLGPFDVGVPRTIVVKDASSSTQMDDVLFGDVWLCSGQSNMEFSMASIPNSQTELQDSNYPDLRLLKVSNTSAGVPQDVVGTVPWRASSANAAHDFSAVCFMMGRLLQKQIGIPVGLVEAAVGATHAEAWVSAETLRTIQDFAAPLAALSPTTTTSDQATVQFNAMIAPLLPMQLKGVAWYQGEWNQWTPYQYTRLLPLLIDDWRKHFGQAALPWIIVQVPNNETRQTVPVEESPNWPVVREAQLLTAQTVDHAGLVVTFDTGQIVPIPGNPANRADLHPLDKVDVAYRLALEIENRVYGLDKPRSPTYSSMSIEGSAIRLSFNDAQQGLMTANKTTFDPVVEDPSGSPKGFAISGADGKWSFATATIDGATVLVSSPSVSAPVAVRYAWGQNPPGNVYGKRGLPISPFRTDMDYMVNVIKGRGTGVYKAGAQVTVAPNSVQAATTWLGDKDVLPNPGAAMNTFSMPRRYLSFEPR
jgi:sialate O-acetylesterase